MSGLLVPITVDTLVVRPGDAAERYADTRYATPQLPSTPNTWQRQAILPAPFGTRAQPRRTGVHLHWAMPDALTRLDAEAGTMPALPCRWLVVRLAFRAGPAGHARSGTAWLQPDVHDPASTWIRDGHTVQRPAGKGSPALTMRGQGATQTFQGWGFYADNLDGRVAFTDPLDHPDDAGLVGPLAYLVAGWYTHPSLDPLRPRAGHTTTEILHDLGWSYDATLPIDAPTRTVLHGAAVGIGWPVAAAAPGLPAELELRPAASDVSVALADTLTAATATLAFPTATGPLADLAEAAVAGELSELDGPDGLSRLDGTRHQLRFRAQGTGRGQADVIFQSDNAAGTPAPPPALPRPLRAAAVRAADATPLPGSFEQLRAAFRRPAAAAGGGPAPLAAAGDDGDLASLESGTFVPVRHPTPRRWGAVDPVAAVGGLGWSLRHGHDGRFDPEFRTLVCRRTGDTLLALHHPARPAGWAGVTVLDPGDPVPAGAWSVTVPRTGQRVAVARWLPTAVGLPDEIEPLIHELATVDPAGVPGYGTRLGGGADADADAGVAARLDWWSTWGTPDDWSHPPPARFTSLGGPPCPLSVTRPSRAWIPLHVDWRLTWNPVVGGAAAFPLGELDFEAPQPWPAGPPGRTLAGRGLLNDGPMRLLALAAAGPLPAGLPAVPELDVAAFSLDGFAERIRGTPEGMWFRAKGIDDVPPVAVVDGEDYPAEPVAAGAWDLRDLRVVDAFGRTLTLLADGAAAAGVGTADTVRAEGAPGVVQRPRFTAPVTLEARFLDPGGATVAPAGGGPARPVQVDSGQNPLVGWLAPTPLDGSVEFFDPDGTSLGRLAIDARTHRTEWADTPRAGQVPSGVVDPLDRLDNPAFARIARSLVDADRVLGQPAGHAGSALGVLLRLVGATLRYVDATAGTGTGHLGLLLGTPLAVVRVGVTVEVRDAQAERAGTLATQLTPVRIGSLTRLTDGVVAFWVEDQPDRVHPVHPLLSGIPTVLDGSEPAPITSAFLARDPVLWVRPGEMRVLTVLLAPGGQITVTAGLAPRKVLDLLPAWTDASAAKLVPTLAFDAVVRPLDGVSLPVAADINGVWTWYSRPSGGTAWEAAEVPAAPPAGALGAQPSRVEDGYLRVRLLPPPDIKGVEFQVTCIRRYGPANTIQEIGVVPAADPAATVTRMKIDEAIRLVQIGRVRFYVEVDGMRAYLVVDRTATGRRYLRTTMDSTTVNNLANLGTC